jgi:hypothetical protein
VRLSSAGLIFIVGICWSVYFLGEETAIKIGTSKKATVNVVVAWLFCQQLPTRLACQSLLLVVAFDIKTL